MTIGTIEERVNGCMTRSMGDGAALAPESREMRGMVAYFKWLAEGTNEHDAMEGTGMPKIDIPARRADPEKGKAVFQQFCLSCHGADGTGTKAPEGTDPDTYLFPPIAGDDSFNDGAGMSRLKTATRFIYGNMPLGTEAGNPVLTVDQAYDVAGYMMSLPRPTRAGRDKDFPDPAFRPADYPVPAYFGDDKAALDKAKYGPFTH